MSYPKKHVRTMNEFVYKEPLAILPDAPASPHELPQKAPFDPYMSDLLLKNLFYYFQQRGFVMTISQFGDGPEQPRVIDITESEEYQGEVSVVAGLRNLEEIRMAGPDYVREFLDFAMELLMDH